MIDDKAIDAADITFRPAEPSDAALIAKYHHRCWQLAFKDLVAPGVVEKMDPWAKFNRWRRWLEPDSEFSTHVANLNGNPIGHVTVAGNELVHLFIDPDYWGQGLGRSLLALGEQMLADAGHQGIQLHTMVGNGPAIKLYESAGWMLTDQLVHNDHGGVVYDEHLLLKQLDRATSYPDHLSARVLPASAPATSAAATDTSASPA